MPQIGYVYRSAGPDCTNGGASGLYNYLTVYGPDEEYDPENKHRFLGCPAPPFRMVPSNLTVMGKPVAVNVKPIDPDTGQLAPGWHMFGGNYVGASDSRFGEMVARLVPALQYAGPVAVHDRVE